VNPREGIKVHTGILSFRELHHGETCEGIFHTLILKNTFTIGPTLQQHFSILLQLFSKLEEEKVKQNIC
jgi:hypothetical protein